MNPKVQAWQLARPCGEVAGPSRMPLRLPSTSRPRNTDLQVGLPASHRDTESPSSRLARVERSLHRGPALEMHRLAAMVQADGPGAGSRKHSPPPGGPGRVAARSRRAEAQPTSPTSPARPAVAARAPCARQLLPETTVRAESFSPNSFQ